MGPRHLRVIAGPALHPSYSAQGIFSVSTAYPTSQDQLLLALLVAELRKLNGQVLELKKGAPIAPPSDVQGFMRTCSHIPSAKYRSIISKSCSSLEAEKSHRTEMSRPWIFQFHWWTEYSEVSVSLPLSDRMRSLIPVLLPRLPNDARMIL